MSYIHYGQIEFEAFSSPQNSIPCLPLDSVKVFHTDCRLLCPLLPRKNLVWFGIHPPEIGESISHRLSTTMSTTPIKTWCTLAYLHQKLYVFRPIFKFILGFCQKLLWTRCKWFEGHWHLGAGAPYTLQTHSNPICQDSYRCSHSKYRFDLNVPSANYRTVQDNIGLQYANLITITKLIVLHNYIMFKLEIIYCE